MSQTYSSRPRRPAKDALATAVVSVLSASREALSIDQLVLKLRESAPALDPHPMEVYTQAQRLTVLGKIDSLGPTPVGPSCMELFRGAAPCPA